MDTKKQTPKKSERTTPEQLNMFVEFCAANSQMATGRNSPSSPKSIQELWEELANSLNAMRGPTKTAAQWKETLGHWKNLVRSRARNIASQNRQTGGGPRTSGTLSELEERALSIFGKSAVYGHAIGSPLGCKENLPSSNAACTAEAQPPDINENSSSTMHIPVEDDASTGSAASASAEASTSISRKRRGTDPDTEALDLLKTSIERNSQQNERAIEAQLETATALKEMAASVLALSQAIGKKKDKKNRTNKEN